MTDSRIGLALALAALAAALSAGGCGSDSSEGCVPAAEACNGADDDCDGEVDEGFDLGAPCAAGVGACAATGLRVCVAGVGACDAVPGEPAAETCDQVDEDCDGQTDEDVAGCCHPPASTRACGADAGACAAGTETCSAQGAWGPCLDGGGAPVVLPGTEAEACNALDDDCDGETDEAWSELGAACTAGIGACARSGALVCDGAGTRCDAVPGDPGAEDCNGLDDDCDGETDEEAVAPGCPLSVGVCAAATQACDGASGWICAYPATYEETEGACDGLDNDCDGQTDETVADPRFGTSCDGTDGDLCQEGQWLCTNGEMRCDDLTATKVEICDGVDDDCDGQTDESWPEIGTACTAGTGACARTGQRLCRADRTGTECSAVPGTPAAEICNGLDDDCDGATDEGVLPTWYLDADGDGWGGATSVQACAAPAGYVANGGDCIDSAADGLPPGQDPRSWNPAAPEYCNGWDENCNGFVNDSPVDPTLGDPCDGADADLCIEGVVTCGDFGLQCTDVSGANLESCNGVDDDCDGSTDEDLAAFAPLCANQQGVCAGAKVVTCGGAAGWLPCDAATFSAYSSSYEQPETRCDGLDNDCDGATDEGVRIASYDDADGDGFGVNSSAVSVCALQPGDAPVGDDCDDTRASVNPGAPEICGNGFDDDCNLTTVDGCP